MQQYHDILQTILADGVETTDRTGTSTISYFGTQSRYDMADGFPLVTTKKLHIPAIIHELLWFLRGETNIRPLLQDKVRIWTDWPYKVYLKHIEESRVPGVYISEYSKSEFEEMIVKDEDFAARWGDLGPVYGAQWRKWPGQPKQWPTRESTGHVDDTTMPGDIDQIEKLIEQIRKTPDSRRLIVSAWNPAEIEDMALPPCHTLWQVKILGGKLHMQLYQRSGDMFLGVPFNIASYSLLLHMLAHVTGYEPGTFIHTMGDAHIYSNHIEQVQLQLTREHFPLPKLVINRKVDSIFDFKFEDFTIEGYEAHPHIKGEVAV